MTCCCSTTPSPITTIRRSALAALDVMCRGRPRRRWRRTAAAAGRRSRRACSTTRARHGRAQRRRCCYADAEAGRPIVFCEPSCLSAVREDAPALLRGEARRKAEVVAKASVLFEEFLAGARVATAAQAGPDDDPAARPLPSEVDGAASRRPRRCSRAFPARRSSISTPAAAAWPARSATPASTTTSRARSASASSSPPCASKPDGAVVVAAGTSCRHQIDDFTGETAVHPAVLLSAAREHESTLHFPLGLALDMNLAWLSLAALVDRDDRQLLHSAQRRRARRSRWPGSSACISAA